MRVQVAVGDSTELPLLWIHWLCGRVDVGFDAYCFRFSLAGKSARFSRRLSVRRVRFASAVPEAFVLHVFSRIAAHFARILLRMPRPDDRDLRSFHRSFEQYTRFHRRHAVRRALTGQLESVPAAVQFSAHLSLRVL